MSKRDYSNEQPGMRHGKLTLLDRQAEYHAYGKVTRLFLWALCDCGREELAEKRRLVERPGPCSGCKAEAKAQRKPKPVKGRHASRNYAAEAPGTRYGKRVVMDRPAEYDAVPSGVKLIMLWVRCDCGDESRVVKGALVNGRSTMCRECFAISQQKARDLI